MFNPAKSEEFVKENNLKDVLSINNCPYCGKSEFSLVFRERSKFIECDLGCSECEFATAVFDESQASALIHAVADWNTYCARVEDIKKEV